MMQLFGKQASMAPPIEISKEAKQVDFLGTNFLAFKHTMPKDSQVPHKDFMSASPDFSSKSFEIPLKETDAQVDNYFNKTGHFALLYGRENDDRVNITDLGAQTEHARGTQLNPLFAKRELAEGRQINPLFAMKQNQQPVYKESMKALPDPNDPYMTYGIRESSEWARIS